MDKETATWDEAKHGIPTCCICLDLCCEPIRLPCTCRSLMCLSCFDEFLLNFSNCLICRERIVPRLRRLLSGKKTSASLVDVALKEYVHTRYKKNGVLAETVARPCQVFIPPEPNELKGELMKMEQDYEAKRKREAELSEHYLRVLLSNGDEDLTYLEVLKRDESFAKELSESLSKESIVGSRNESSGARNHVDRKVNNVQRKGFISSIDLFFNRSRKSLNEGDKQVDGDDLVVLDPGRLDDLTPSTSPVDEILQTGVSGDGAASVPFSRGSSSSSFKPPGNEEADQNQLDSSLSKLVDTKSNGGQQLVLKSSLECSEKENYSENEQSMSWANSNDVGASKGENSILYEVDVDDVVVIDDNEETEPRCNIEAKLKRSIDIPGSLLKQTKRIKGVPKVHVSTLTDWFNIKPS